MHPTFRARSVPYPLHSWPAGVGSKFPQLHGPKRPTIRSLPTSLHPSGISHSASSWRWVAHSFYRYYAMPSEIYRFIVKMLEDQDELLLGFLRGLLGCTHLMYFIFLRETLWYVLKENVDKARRHDVNDINNGWSRDIDRVIPWFSFFQKMG